MRKTSQIKKQKAIFNKKSRKAQEYKLENFHLSYLKRCFSSLKIPGEGEYLDIGCGAYGHMVVEAARRKQKAVGLDLSKEIITKARNFAQKELGKNNLYRFVVGQAESLPFPKNSLTKVSAIALLEHIKDDEKVIAEIAKALRPGGRVFLTVPNSYQKIGPIFGWYYRRVDKEMGHLRHYEAKDLQKRFEKYGFKLVKLAYTGHLPKMFQYFLTLIFPAFAHSQWWWRLEEIDLKMDRNSSGVHFDLTMEKQR